jgi:uncharacterized protein (TIGR00730 family)
MRKTDEEMQADQPPAMPRRVTVYASSSGDLAEEYYDAAARLGTVLGRAGIDIVYGGGGVGLMRAMADNAMREGAHVHGVIPHFLNTVEHGHSSLSRLEVVEDMRERKHRMIAAADAVISLPGGSGTFEELFEALTLKRLGQFLGPIVLINTRGYFDRFVDFLEHSVRERFMSDRHLEMWSLVREPEDVLQAMVTAKPWSRNARKFAAVRQQQPGP